MTSQQNRAIYELERQGLHRFAGVAEECWRSGHSYILDASISVPRMVRHLVEQCNREVLSVLRPH